MHPTPARILLLFLDGVGVGEPEAERNPLAAAPLPHLRRWLGGALPLRGSAPPAGGAPGRWVAVDATLGVPGRPQSGTGQTALLTGRNAPALFGRHFGSWVPTALRPLLERESLLAQAVARGWAACFANAYPLHLAERWVERRPPAPPLAARAAGLLSRGIPELRAGEAVASEITHERWRARFGGEALPPVSAREAGWALARLAAAHHFTFFAHYDTDLAGHQRELAAGIAALQKVDAFLAGVLERLPADTLLVVASDHGNLEDVAAGHTLNPVPVLAAGPGRDHLLGRLRALTDVAPAILDLLDQNH